MVSVDAGGRLLLAPTSGMHTAGQADPTCPTISKGFCLLYIPSSRYIGKKWCPRFGAKFYAKTRKCIIFTFKQFSTAHRFLYGPVTYKFISIYLHQQKIFTMHPLPICKFHCKSDLKFELSCFRVGG